MGNRILAYGLVAGENRTALAPREPPWLSAHCQAAAMTRGGYQGVYYTGQHNPVGTTEVHYVRFRLSFLF
jgi:hypothetical protein